MKDGNDYKKKIEEMRKQPDKIKGNFGDQQPAFTKDKKKDKQQGR